MHEPELDRVDAGSIDAGHVDVEDTQDFEQPNARKSNAHEFSAARPSAVRPNASRLNRGFDAYAHPASHLDSARSDYSYQSSDTTTGSTLPHVPVSRRDRHRHPAVSSLTEGSPSPIHQRRLRKRFAWLLPWRKKEPLMADAVPSQSAPSQAVPSQAAMPLTAPVATPLPQGQAYSGPPLPYPVADEEGVVARIPTDEIASPYVPDSSGLSGVAGRLVRSHQRTYDVIAYSLLTAGAVTSAWLFGILVAQVVPGRFERPPIQESLLRKSSRLADRLWHFSGLWQTPTHQINIEAIPLPETGPIAGTLDLSPIERQPLLDELNAIDTELLTLDRRLAGIEKRLGNPSYQGAALEHRINSLRVAIDPPVRRSSDGQSDGQSDEQSDEQAKEPMASELSETLLEVAKLKLTLPSDALFTPGQSELASTDLSIDLLGQALDQLLNYPGATVSVRSYSDDQTDAIAAREYTLAQAQALARYLDRSLPGDYRWISVGMGQSEPVRSNDSVVNRQKNRRIEILVDAR